MTRTKVDFFQGIFDPSFKEYNTFVREFKEYNTFYLEFQKEYKTYKLEGSNFDSCGRNFCFILIFHSYLCQLALKACGSVLASSFTTSRRF